MMRYLDVYGIEEENTFVTLRRKLLKIERRNKKRVMCHKSEAGFSHHDMCEMEVDFGKGLALNIGVTKE